MTMYIIKFSFKINPLKINVSIIDIISYRNNDFLDLKSYNKYLDSITHIIPITISSDNIIQC